MRCQVCGEELPNGTPDGMHWACLYALRFHDMSDPEAEVYDGPRRVCRDIRPDQSGDGRIVRKAIAG